MDTWRHVGIKCTMLYTLHCFTQYLVTGDDKICDIEWFTLCTCARAVNESHISLGCDAFSSVSVCLTFQFF